MHVATVITISTIHPIARPIGMGFAVPLGFRFTTILGHAPFRSFILHPESEHA